MFIKLKKHPSQQYLISLLSTSTTVIICYFLLEYIGYQAVALILLLMVSVLAMLFDIFPVLTTALLSALIWNFFFIPPVLTFHIGTPEDALMFLMYFVIALINAVLTFKIRSYEKKISDKAQQEKTIQLYNTLLNSLSHELRTPISTIIGSIDMIKENEDKLSPNSKKELLAEIETASLRLNRQVENLLNMSRLEADTLHPKLDWCDINELIYTIIKNNKEEAAKHTIVFETKEELPLFKIDGGLLEQALHNILYNALIHTPLGSTIKIEALKKMEGFQLIISDNGNGFPEDKIAVVFDKFYRLPNSATGGTGLGLSISKGFVEAHLGTIKLENGLEGGAKFSITIPAEMSFVKDLED